MGKRLKYKNNYLFYLIKLLLLLFVLVLDITAQDNGLMRYISFENAEILTSGNLREASMIYKKSISGNAAVELIDDDSFHGERAIIFRTPAADSTQRYEFKLSNYDESEALGFDNEGYVGFAAKIPKDFDPLQGSLLFFQAWQGSPWGPPIMLKITSGSNPYNLRLTIRNLETGPDSNLPDQELWSGTMFKERWYSLVVGMKPRVEGDSSHIQLWIDDHKVLNWENQGNIGYKPESFDSDKPYPKLVLKFGAYQPGSNLGHNLLFDEVRYAHSYEDAVPSKRVDIKEFEDTSLPTFQINQNYPNPFNPSTTIEYSIAKPGNVQIAIFNTLGQKVKTLVDEHKLIGSYSVSFNANNLTSGVYSYTIEANGFRQSKKMILNK